MARGIRHARTNRASSRRSSQVHLMLLVRPLLVKPPQEEPPKRRRKSGSHTRLAQPRLGSKVALKPTGDI